MLKRLAALFVMIGLITGLISSPAHAAEVTFPCGTSGSYTVADGVLTGHTACEGNLNIDSSVVEIADYAFQNNANLAAISIPGSVITIGVQAFNSASATSLTLGEGIIEIKSNAFSSLNTSGSSLDITIPDSVTTLGDAVFQQNTIGSVIIGDSIVNIPSQAFYSNSGGGPTSVEFGSSVKNIGAGSFVGYRGRSLYLPEGIETIDSAAFSDAFINALLLPVTLTSIANDAFSFSPKTTVYCGSNPDISNYAFPEPNNAKVCGKLVYFDGNGSNNNDSAQQVSSNAVNLTTFNWRKTGSTFLRWTSNRDGTGVQYANGALFPFSARITTLYAQWGVRETLDDSAITLGDSICDLAIAGMADGTADKPYLIGTAKQLAEINDCNDGTNYKHYRQSVDIDLTPTSDGSQDGWNDTRALTPGANQYSTGGWVPIGDYNGDSDIFVNRSFRGSYDGNLKSVTGMTINRGSSYQGLFGQTNLSEIKNLTIGSVTKSAAGSIRITARYSYLGVAAGEADRTNFKNVHVKNVNISGAGVSVGGLVGYAQNSNATDVSYFGDITATTGTLLETGGIFGYSRESHMKRAIVEGNITCDFDSAGSWSTGEKCGGLIGVVDSGSISQVRFTGDVSASRRAGGIIGYTISSVIDSAEFNGRVLASFGTGNQLNTQSVGGITGGVVNGGLQNVVSNGDVIVNMSSEGESAFSVGGIVGYSEGASVINALAKGNVAVIGTSSADGAVQSIGGAVGYATYSGIFDVKVSANVTVVDGRGVGGILGYGDYGASVSRSSFSGALNLNYRDNINLDAGAGGAIGIAEYGVQLTSTTVTKDASVTVAAPLTEVGGLIGSAAEGVTISDSYNRAPVAGYDQVGGIVGHVRNKAVSVFNTYNMGTVTANVSATDKDVFAAGGNFKEGLSLSNTFDNQSTGAATSVTGVVGNTTAAMKSKSTFEALGFDFNSASPIWAIDSGVNDGYPHLIGADGNAPAPAAPVAAAPIVAKGVVFDTFKLNKFSENSSKISKANKVKLAAYAAALKAGGYSKVTVRAFTKSENTALSTRRALAVAKLLKKYGVTVVIRNESVVRKSNSLNNQVRLIAKKG